VTNIVTVLADRSELPLFSCIEAARIFEGVLQYAYAGVPFRQAASEPIATLLSTVRMFALEIAEKIEHLLEQIQKRLGNEETILSIRFRERPSTALVQLVDSLAEALHLPNRLRLLREEPGSVVQILAGTTGTILLVLTSLCLLNGVIDQLIVMRSKLRILSNKVPTPKTYQDLIRRPMALKDVPVDFVGKVVRAALQLPVVHDPTVGGLTRANIEEIKIDRPLPSRRKLERRKKLGT
jgi:hypothetical protein